MYRAEAMLQQAMSAVITRPVRVSLNVGMLFLRFVC
jgi:hypothetical protein